MWGSHPLVRTCVSTLEHQSYHLPEVSSGTSVPIHTFKSSTCFSLTGCECLCSMEGRMSCFVCFQNETQGTLGIAFPEVTSAIPACVSLAVGGLSSLSPHLRAKPWQEREENRVSLTASLCTSEFELSFCAHNVVTRAVLLTGEFISSWQRGKGNLLSAVYEYSWKKKVDKTMTMVSKSQMQGHSFSK